MKTKILTLFGLFFLCILFCSWGQNNQQLDSLLQLYATQHNDSLKLSTLNELFQIYREKSPTKAVEYVKEHMALAKILQHKEAVAAANFNYGLYYLDKGQTDSSLYHFNLSKKSYAKIDNLFKPKLIDYYLATIENRKANYTGAKTLIQKGISKPAKNRKDSLLLLRLITLDAAVQSNIDDQKKSIEQGLYALELARKIKDRPREAAALKALGSSYHYASNYERALQYKKKALIAYEALNDFPMVGVMLNNIGNGVSVMGDEKAAIPYFEKSLKISREFQNNNMIAITSFNLGRSYVRLGLPKKGIPHFQESLYISKNITKAPKTEMWALNGAGNAYNKLNQPLKAIPLLTRTIKISDSINRKADKAVAYDYRSSSYELLGQLEKSLNDARRFKEVADSISEIERLEEIERLTVVYETEKKEQQIARQKTEISLLEEKEKVSRLQKIAMGGGLGLSALVLGFGFYGFRQKTKRNLLEKQKVDVELAFKKSELEFKRKELTTQALQLAKKNETLENLKQKASELKSSQVHNGYQQLITAINFDLQDDNNWENFARYFEEVHKDFNSNVAKNYPEVTSNELRLMALLKMNLSSKEIANILNISIHGIKKARQRLRKKMQLSSTDSLENAVLSIS